MVKKRNYKLDNIRTLAIILVVLGHSIIIYSTDWGLYVSMRKVVVFDYMKKLINIIQMPVFFSLSGFLFRNQVAKKSMSDIFKSKFVRLMIPYYCIALGWMIPIKILIDYPAYQNRNIFNIVVEDILLFNDNGHLWYLPCLFLCFLLGKAIFSALG